LHIVLEKSFELRPVTYVMSDIDSLNENDLMIRIYARHVCWFLHFVLKLFPNDSARRDEVLQKFSEIAVEYRQNMFDTDRLSRNLRNNILQGSTRLNYDNWLKTFEERAE